MCYTVVCIVAVLNRFHRQVRTPEAEESDIARLYLPLLQLALLKLPSNQNTMAIHLPQRRRASLKHPHLNMDASLLLIRHTQVGRQLHRSVNLRSCDEVVNPQPDVNSLLQHGTQIRKAPLMIRETTI